MINLKKYTKACVFASMMCVCGLVQAQTSTVEGWDFQTEYLRHNKSDKHVDNYNLHVYTHLWNNDYLSLYGGGIATIADGYMDREERNNSDAVGIGPSVMARLEFNPFGNFYAGLEAAGSMRFFTKAHPAGGRCYDFLWQVGPRLSYKFGNYTAVGISAYYAHASNGMNSHNPGYEMKGLALDVEYKF